MPPFEFATRLSLLIQYVPLVADEDMPLVAVGGDGRAEDWLRDRFLDEMRRAIGQNEIDAIPKAQFGQWFFGVVNKVRGFRPGNGLARFDDEEGLGRAVGEIADLRAHPRLQAEGSAWPREDLVVGRIRLFGGRPAHGRIYLRHLGQQVPVVFAVPGLVKVELLGKLVLPDERQDG